MQIFRSIFTHIIILRINSSQQANFPTFQQARQCMKVPASRGVSNVEPGLCSLALWLPPCPYSLRNNYRLLTTSDFQLFYSRHSSGNTLSNNIIKNPCSFHTNLCTFSFPWKAYTFFPHSFSFSLIISILSCLFSILSFVFYALYRTYHMLLIFSSPMFSWSTFYPASHNIFVLPSLPPSFPVCVIYPHSYFSCIISL